jgi:hypothetical protein
VLPTLAELIFHNHLCVPQVKETEGALCFTNDKSGEEKNQLISMLAVLVLFLEDKAFKYATI